MEDKNEIKNMYSEDMTDAELLKEFVKRFNIDGAVLFYLDGDHESGLSRWVNKNGENWCKKILKSINPDIETQNK